MCGIIDAGGARLSVPPAVSPKPFRFHAMAKSEFPTELVDAAAQELREWVCARHLRSGLAALAENAEQLFLKAEQLTGIAKILLGQKADPPPLFALSKAWIGTKQEPDIRQIAARCSEYDSGDPIEVAKDLAFAVCNFSLHAIAEQVTGLKREG